jgi:heme-degrading monooxygenase HmoA
MYVRVVRLKNDPARADEGVKAWTEHVLPAVKKQPGFLGITLAGNELGDGLGVSYWKSEAEMIASRDKVLPEAMKVMQSVGSSIVEDDMCEVAVMERSKPAQSGVFARVTTLHVDASQADAGIANFKQTVVPAVLKMAGNRGAFQFVNRTTGKAFAGSWWDTNDALTASEAGVKTIRNEAITKFGGSGTKVEAFEILYTEIATQAPVTV